MELFLISKANVKVSIWNAGRTEILWDQFGTATCILLWLFLPLAKVVSSKTVKVQNMILLLNKEFYLTGKQAIQSNESTNVWNIPPSSSGWKAKQERNQHEADSKKLVYVLGLCLVVPHVLYCWTSFFRWYYVILLYIESCQLQSIDQKRKFSFIYQLKWEIFAQRIVR
jgi:hypothetical protein